MCILDVVSTDFSSNYQVLRDQQINWLCSFYPQLISEPLLHSSGFFSCVNAFSTSVILAIPSNKILSSCDNACRVEAPICKLNLFLAVQFSAR